MYVPKKGMLFVCYCVEIHKKTSKKKKSHMFEIQKFV